MAPRPEDDTLTESELAEIKRNLLLLRGPCVQSFYRDAHKATTSTSPQHVRGFLSGVFTSTVGGAIIDVNPTRDPKRRGTQSHHAHASISSLAEMGGISQS